MKITPADSENIRLVQITDTHISDDTGAQFEDVDTTESLRRVIQAISALEPVPDAILLTGDLVHDATEKVYRKLLQLLAGLPIPVICLPGNHDDPALMERILNDRKVSTVKQLYLHNWTVILLSTWIPASHSGRLSLQELELLEETVAANEDKHILVCLHHHPVKIDSPWMDAMMLENPEPFFEIVDKNRHVRGVLWGHIHQEFYRERNGTILLGSPSTCVQFMPRSSRFAKDTLPPAFRNLTLCPEGRIESTVTWAVDTF